MSKQTGTAKLSDAPTPDPHDKDGVHYTPTNLIYTCSRCATSLRLHASHPIGESNNAVWNDDGWFGLSRFVGRDAETPSRFEAMPIDDRTDANGFPLFSARQCVVHLCKSCGDKFNEWLARAD